MQIRKHYHRLAALVVLLMLCLSSSLAFGQAQLTARDICPRTTLIDTIWRR
jgi:hypothetical protein